MQCGVIRDCRELAVSAINPLIQVAIGMPLKTAPLEEPSINLTSMLDIVMLLIIFFMVSTKFAEEERQTGIQLPSVSENFALSGQPDEIVVNVDVHGQIKVHDEELAPDSLKVMLNAARSVFPNQAVVIRGDGRCEYQLVMDVFSICKEVGIKNVSVAHVPKTRGL
jgi:biopolymer transport protein ExbD